MTELHENNQQARNLIDTIKVLRKEVEILTERLRPAGTGYLHVAIDVLNNRIDELIGEAINENPDQGRDLAGQIFDDYLPESKQHENYLKFEKEFLKEEVNEGHIRVGTSSYNRAADSFQKEICSCGHKVIDCDCKAGCKCGCNKRFLGAN